MTSIFLTAFLLLASTVSLASNCVDSQGRDILNQPDIFLQQIHNSGSCSEASELAQACSWGSSIDVKTAGTAYAKCETELNLQSPSTEITDLLSTMNSACNKKYESAAGTLYLSMNAYCHLSAIEWIVNLASPN